MEKTYKATQKFLLMSPRKLRQVVSLVKEMKPQEAVEKLPFAGRRAGMELAKVIKNAMASAKNQGIGETDLIFKEIRIGQGPSLKRGRAASRGRWHPYKRRMSHVRVVLAAAKLSRDKEDSKVKIKKEVKRNVTKS
jgi:large subunit ribosomal protein L22